MSDLQAIRDEGDELYMSCLAPADWFRSNWPVIAAALRERERVADARTLESIMHARDCCIRAGKYMEAADLLELHSRLKKSLPAPPTGKDTP